MWVFTAELCSHSASSSLSRPRRRARSSRRVATSCGSSADSSDAAPRRRRGYGAGRRPPVRTASRRERLGCLEERGRLGRGVVGRFDRRLLRGLLLLRPRGRRACAEPLRGRLGGFARDFARDLCRCLRLGALGAPPVPCRACPSRNPAAGIPRRRAAHRPRHARQGVVGLELVARRREGFRRGPRDAHADDVAAQAPAALREWHVIGVARNDHDMREVGEPEHVFDGIHREADVGAVLRVRRGGEELHEIDRAGDELAAVDRVHGRRPVGVGARQDESAQRRGVIDDRADVDRRRREAFGDLGIFGCLDDPLTVAPVRVPAVHPVVPGDDDVVEVEVDGDAGILGVGHPPSVTGRPGAACGRGAQASPG